MNNKPIIRRINNRTDWFQALRVIDGKTFVAFGNSARTAAILLNTEISKEKQRLQPTLPL